MLTQRQYDEFVMEAAKALPMIAQALTDANTLKCVVALYNNGEVTDGQVAQVLYAILARKEEPDVKVQEPTSRIRYSEEYRRKRQGTSV